MFDYKKIAKLGRSVISMDGKTVYNEGLITDENEKLEAQVASLIYEEALLVWNAQKENGVTFENICNRFIEVYGLNGETNDTPINKALRTLLEKEDMTLNLGGVDLTDSPYNILAHSEKGRGLAVLRYKAHLMGFDIENLNFDYNPGQSTIHLSYTKRPLAQKTKSIFDMTPEEKYEYANSELEKARKNADTASIEYWEALLKNHKFDFLKKSNPKFTDREATNYAYEEQSNALKSHDDATANHWQNVIEELEDKRVYPFESEVKKFYSGFQDAIKLGNATLARMYATGAQNLFNQYPLTMPPEKWNILTPEEKSRYDYLKVMESALFENKHEFDYWRSQYKKYQEELQKSKSATLSN